MHNAHITCFYAYRCRRAEWMRDFGRQWYYYTLAKLEIDPAWHHL